MLLKSMTECVLDIEKHGHLVRVQEEIDPNLEMAEFYEHSGYYLPRPCRGCSLGIVIPNGGAL